MTNTKNITKTTFSKSIINLIKNIRYSFSSLKLILAGVYFTYFVKVYKSNGLSILIPLNLTDFKFRGRFIFNTYEVEEAKYLSQYLPSDSKVIELGSCLGFVSCLTNKILDDKSKHVVLEANPNLLEWIKKNKENNNCSFTIENSVISKQKQIPFYIHDLIVGGSLKRKTEKQVNIEGVTFDFLQKKHNIIFDTLIMDIEGGELELFRSHKESIANFKTIFYEVHPFANILTQEESQECEKILLDLNFKMVLREGHFQIWTKS